MASDEAASFEYRKVGAWLRNQYGSASSIVDTLPKVGGKRKRDLESHDIHSSNPRRKPLQETTMNPRDVEPTKRTKRDLNPPSRQRQPQRVSPRKNAPPQTDGADDSEYSGGLRDVDITLSPRRGTVSNSSTQSRSSSPVKTIHDLTMADPPIIFYEANAGATKPPHAIRQLYKRVVNVQDGFGLLPESLQENIIAYCEEFETRVPRNEYFKPSSDPAKKPTLEELHRWEAVKRIRENAKNCSQDGDSEAGWGEMVYCQILEEGIRCSPCQDSIGWKNITAARIEPKSLGPKHLSGKLFGSKMVDYSIVLRPSHTMHQAILQVLHNLPENEQNINQTRSAPVKYRPITVNIEVKVPGAGKNETMVQLAVWAAAQLEKLNLLSGSLVPIGIPLVSAEGHEWRLSMMYQTEDSGSLRQVVCGNEIFADSSSVLGIYKSLAAIEILAEWSNTEYRAWFEQNILKLEAPV